MPNVESVVLRGRRMALGASRPGGWRLLAAILSLVCVAGGTASMAAARTSITAASSCPQPVSQAWPIDRIAGTDRFATATCASRAAYPAAAGGVVVLARGDTAGGWSDALAGSLLAHAVDGPVLLTEPRTLPEATAEELARLQPRRVVVLGGLTAIDDGVLSAVAVAVPDAAVERLHGPDRHATAAAVSALAGGGETAFIVNGFRPADALVAAAPASRMGAKLLLTGPDTLSSVTRTALAGVTDVVIVGGYAVVGERVQDDLESLLGEGHVRRVSGGDRTETAASVARAFPAAGRLHLATTADHRLVDAIAAGWLAARPGGGAVLYSHAEEPGTGTDRYLRLGGLAGWQAGVRLIGGATSLSPDLVTVLEDRLQEAAAGGPPPQLRGMWVHLFDDSVKSAPGIDAMLDRAAAANLNTVIVQVARRQDAYYRSTILPRTPDPSMPPDLDLIGRLVPAAHDRGLAVHAWVAVLPAWHETYAGLHLPFWDAHGAGSADPWVSVSRDGVQGTMLDPGVPEVAAHAAAVAAEIASSYDVDAVHLDYLRYESEQWGYHPTSLTRFRAAYGLAESVVPAVDDPRFDDWRRRMTGEVARAISDAVHAAAPGVAVTMAASTMGAPPVDGDYRSTRTWHDVFQPWPEWLAEGVVDAAMPMLYFREPSHAAYFDGWLEFAARIAERCAATGCTVAVGQAAYLNTVQDSLSQLGQVVQRGLGPVVYSYQVNAVDGAPQALLAVLGERLLTVPAAAPGW